MYPDVMMLYVFDAFLTNNKIKILEGPLQIN